MHKDKTVYCLDVKLRSHKSVIGYESIFIDIPHSKLCSVTFQLVQIQILLKHSEFK